MAAEGLSGAGSRVQQDAWVRAVLGLDLAHREAAPLAETSAQANGRRAAGDAADRAAKPEAGPQGAFVRMQKSRLIWGAARKKVESEIAALKSAITAMFKGDPDEAEAQGALKQLDEILVRCDLRLIDKLDELLQETEPTRHAALLDEAKGLVGDYVAFTQTSPLVAKLEGATPLGVQLSVRSTFASSLQALEATLR